MHEPSNCLNPESTAQAIHKLTVAVWILAILIGINILISSLSLFGPSRLVARMMNTIPGSPILSATAYNGFGDWPLEKRIQSSSAIALAKWQREGETLKCVISEILKQDPGTTFFNSTLSFECNSLLTQTSGVA